MPFITTLTLPNPGPVISTFVQIQYTEHEYGYDITEVAEYRDAACTKIHTDFCIDELPGAMQDVIYAAIDAKRNRQRGLRRLRADLDADAYAQRLMDGARA